MGEKACSLDAVAYAFLANLLWAPVPNAVQAHAQQFPQLERYCQHMKNTYYG